MIANIFDEALADWIRKGQPHGATHTITAPVHDNRSLIWPSRMAACPCAHAHERRGDEPRLLITDTPEHSYRMALGHETARRWADILATAGHNVWTEQAFETDDFSGHLDIVLKQAPDSITDLVIEIKDTGMRMTQSHFWQAASYAYAHPSGRCALILDHRDGTTDLIGIWAENYDWMAYDLRTGNPIVWRGQKIYRITDAEFQERIELHRHAYKENPEDYRLPAITHTKCVRVDNKRDDAETICPYWCWSEEVQAHWGCKDWNIDIGTGIYPVTKGEW